MTRRTDWAEETAEAGTVPGAGSGAGDCNGLSVPDRPEEQARVICLRLLASAPRTREQLAAGMRRHGVSAQVVETVLARFEDVGLVDDAAFARAWVESRHHARGLSGRALARELRSRGVDEQLIEDAVGRLAPGHEEHTARTLVERRLPATRGLSPEKRLRRMVGMLARKGYGEGLAVRVVRRALEEEGEDPELLQRWLPGD